MLKFYRPQSGVTLVELLIGMLIGVIVSGAALAVFIISVKGQTDNIKLSRLNQDMRTMMDLMERDIRRAGFVTSFPAANEAYLQNNPFFDDTGANPADIAVYNTGSCIVYAYNRNDDSNGDGVQDETPPAVNGTERLGFRLSNGKLEMRKSGDSNADCGGVWETITDREVEITNLNFVLNTTTLNVTSMATDTDRDTCYDGDDQNPSTPESPCVTGTYGNDFCDSGEGCNTCTRDGSPDPACLYVRKVTITLTGRLANDTSVQQTITEQVRLRNDKFLAAIP